MEFGNPIVGLEDLIRSAIKSPDFDVNSETGVTGWRIARDGTATFNNLVIGNPNFTLNANGDLVVHSITLNAADDETGITLHGEDIDPELYNHKARGLVSWVDLPTSVGNTTGTGDIIVGQMSYTDFDATRTYRISSAIHLDVQGTAPTYVGARFRYAWDAVPTAASPLLGSWQWGGRSTSQTDVIETISMPINIDDLGTPGSVLNISVSVFASLAGVRFQGETWTNLVLEDIGELLTRAVYVPGGGTAPPASYTKTYSANESASYQEDGSNRGIADCYQGRYSATNGNQFSMIGFDDALIRTDLTGATVTKVELYLNNNHFFANAGGNAIIGTHNQTTLSGTHSSSQVTDNIQATHFDLGQAKWITIPNSIGTALKNNTAKGIALGPGPSTSQSYYGYFAGNGQTGEPQLRITYTK